MCLFRESKICSIAMFIVDSLHISWMLNPTFTLCQSTLLKLRHSNSYDFLNLQRLVTSVHMSFLQLNDMEFVTSQLL